RRTTAPPADPPHQPAQHPPQDFDPKDLHEDTHTVNRGLGAPATPMGRHLVPGVGLDLPPPAGWPAGPVMVCTREVSQVEEEHRCRGHIRPSPISRAHGSAPVPAPARSRAPPP